jgi:hypothetical protein
MLWSLLVLFGCGVPVFCQVIFLTTPPANITHEVVTFDRRAVAEAAAPLSRDLLGLSIELVTLV